MNRLMTIAVSMLCVLPLVQQAQAGNTHLKCKYREDFAVAIDGLSFTTNFPNGKTYNFVTDLESAYASDIDGIVEYEHNGLTASGNTSGSVDLNNMTQQVTVETNSDPYGFNEDNWYLSSVIDMNSFNASENSFEQVPVFEVPGFSDMSMSNISFNAIVAPVNHGVDSDDEDTNMDDVAMYYSLVQANSAVSGAFDGHMAMWYYYISYDQTRVVENGDVIKQGGESYLQYGQGVDDLDDDEQDSAKLVLVGVCTQLYTQTQNYS